MSWLSDRLGINVNLRKLVPGADRVAVRKALEAMRLDAATLRLVAAVSTEMAAQKEKS